MSEFDNSLSGSDFYGFDPQERLENSESSELDLSRDEISERSNYSSEQSLDHGSDNNNNETAAKYFYGKDRFKWSSSVPQKKGRPRAENIITEKSGLKGPAAQLPRKSEPVSFYSLIITDDMFEDIMKHTNDQIRKQQEKYKDQDKPDCREVDMIELKAFIGLLNYSAVFKANHESIYSLFATDGTGRDIFRSTMSRNRFTFLMDCLRFDDKTVREEKRLSDPAVLISEIFEKFIKNSQANFTIGEAACIDEMLCGFRGKCGFRVYMPNKPNKYGLRLNLLTDAKKSYVLNGYIYCGKGSDGMTLSIAEKKLSVPSQSVVRLVKPIENSNRNVTADNWFSSIEIVQEFKKRGLTYVGTVRKNKREIPPTFVKANKKSGREVNSSLYGFTQDLTLVSYVPKQGKVVLLISSMHHSASTGANGKPDIINYYNSTKAGVDSMDQKCANYSTSRKTRRWPLAIFHAILGMASVNAYILYCETKNPKLTRFKFIKSIAFSLILPHLQRKNLNNIPVELRLLVTKLRKPLQEVTNDSGSSPEVKDNQKASKRKRCFLCPRQKNRKTSHSCIKCKNAICLQCSQNICNNCTF